VLETPAGARRLDASAGAWPRPGVPFVVATTAPAFLEHARDAGLVAAAR
jgi:hypothetical protein